MLFDFASTTSLPFLPYLLLSVLTMAEGPLATLMGGAASSSGLLLPIPAYFSVVIGNLISDLGWYSLGRFGKLEWLKRFGSKVGLKDGRIDQLQAKVQQFAPRLLFLSKLTVGFPIPTLVATGLSRVPVRRWALAWILGELIKSAALVAVGYLFAQVLQQASSSVRYVLWGSTPVIGISVWIWFKRRKSK
jgi:membrane protein DedA with SNARE-associated domain